MTKEEIITKVWEHFVLDGSLPGRVGAYDLAASSVPRCRAMCAVGILLSSHSDREAFDKLDLSHSLSIYKVEEGEVTCSEEAKNLLREHRPLLHELQCDHDVSAYQGMSKSVRKGNTFGLNIFRRLFMFRLLRLAAEHNVTLHWADGRPVE